MEKYFTGAVQALSHEGRGISSHENKTVFIHGALPSETVVYKITNGRRNYYEAEVAEVITPSKNRTTPPCMHFGLCGGCSLQHMNIAAQLELKEQTLLEHLHHFGQVKPQEMLPPLSANSVEYRRKARLGVKFVIKKNKVLVGFREKSSNYLAELEHCEVLHPRVGKLLPALRELIAALSIYRFIPQIEVAIGDEDIALVFRHMQALTSEDKAKLIAFGQQHHFHIYLQPGSPQTVHKIWPTSSSDYIRYSLPDFALEFLFHPLDFTQINLEINRLMVQQALNLLTIQKNETVLDLFCGIGNFSLPLARHAQHVTGIEGSNEMVTRAANNALHNHIANVTFHAANLMETNASAAWMMPIDKMLLDPPRAGALEILHNLPKLAPSKILYVSCNTATLARDANEIVHKQGYHLTKAGIMNMFPHTSHIEAMALFEKK